MGVITGELRGPPEATTPSSLPLREGRCSFLLSGCGHAGIINTLEYARAVIRNAPVYAAIGGFHLSRMNDEKLEWTASKLREYGLANFMGAHCTGIEAVYKTRQLTGLTRQTCPVGATGGVFELGKKMDPGQIAR